MVKLLNVNPRTGNRANNLILNGDESHLLLMSMMI